jgi:hypothetical protein
LGQKTGELSTQQLEEISGDKPVCGGIREPGNNPQDNEVQEWH